MDHFRHFPPRQSAKKPSFIDQILLRFGTPETAIDQLILACESKPVDARLDLQVFLNAMGREEESFAVSQELVALAPEDPRVLFNQGWHWLKRGQLQKGMALLEFGRPLNTYGNGPLLSSRPLWRPGPGSRNQRVHLVLEGGFGDEIIHFRFGENLVKEHDCKVTVICQPSLASLFGRQPWVSAVAQREAALGIYHDSWLPGMSAALALGYEYGDLSGKPYLTADTELIRDWADRLGRTGKRIKVGIRWAGRPDFEHQQLRLFPPELLLNLRKHSQEIQLYSFQRDDHLLDLPEEIEDLSADLKSWDDTAAALMNMDLVISSCTSVAHLSAALGKETWVLVPALPYFIWASPGTKSPWYDSVRLFRQARFGSWEDVRTELENCFVDWVRRHVSTQTGHFPSGHQES